MIKKKLPKNFNDSKSHKLVFLWGRRVAKITKQRLVFQKKLSEVLVRKKEHVKFFESDLIN